MELKVNELKINNFVQITKEKEREIIEGPEPYDNIFKIKSLKEDESDEIEIYNDIENVHSFTFLEELEPIELTEAWLLSLGFIKIGMMSHYYTLKKIKLDINTLGVVRFHWSRKVVYLDYVHQLQNLYFSLTNIELQLK